MYRWWYDRRIEEKWVTEGEHLEGEAGQEHPREKGAVRIEREVDDGVGNKAENEYYKEKDGYS